MSFELMQREPICVGSSHYYKGGVRRMPHRLVSVDCTHPYQHVCIDSYYDIALS